MEKQILYNSNMHFEHKQWKGEIAYWKDELKSFNLRLSELVTRWATKEVLAQIGYYQSKFILHGGVIDDLLETIEQHEIRIEAQSETTNNVIDTQLSEKHFEFRNRIETQRDIYAELKKSFFVFLEKNL